MPLTTESAARKDRTTANGGPELQHRHFAFIAATLAQVRPADGIYKGAHLLREQWRDTVDHFANTCASSNPRFDRARFLAACGVQS